MAEAGPVREATRVRDKNWESDILSDFRSKSMVFLLVCWHSMPLLSFMSFHKKVIFIKFSISEGGVQ